MVTRPSSPVLPLGQRLTPAQLTQINAHLDRLLLALYALTGLDAATWQQALREASTLDLPAAGEAIARLEHPQAIQAPTEASLDLDSVRTLAAVIGQLARQYQELLRRSVALIEQTLTQGSAPFLTTLLGEYRDKLRQLDTAYRRKHPQGIAPLTDDRALSLLTELLFYSSQDGVRRLWRVLLVEAQTLAYESL